MSDVSFYHAHYGLYLPSLFVLDRSSVLEGIEHASSFGSLGNSAIINRAKRRDERFYLELVPDHLETLLCIKSGIGNESFY